MINAYDFMYALGTAAAAPIWLARADTRAKVLKGFRDRMGHVPHRQGTSHAIMIHAVSLGEINAARELVRLLAEARPGLHFIISATTQTGFDRGRELFGSDPRCTLIRYPLDFTPAINRVLDRLRPDAVVLMELEVWPNFLLQCVKRNVPVVLMNGRLTTPSFRRYRYARPFTRPMFYRLSAVGAQEQAYADRFIALGVRPERVHVTGTMKFDTAQVAARIEGDSELANALGLRPGQEPIWVCGSTGPGEEQIILDSYRQLLASLPNLRLVIVPRKPERFDEVAELIRGREFDVIRRSQSQIAGSNRQVANQKSQIANRKSPMEGQKLPAAGSPPPPVVLGDTMGELRKFYSLADVVFAGRSLVDLGPRQHGSDMIEPAALAKPVIVGPYTGNFAEVMNCFRDARAIREIARPDDLAGAIESCLADRPAASAMGLRAQQIVGQQQGATRRNIQLILKHLPDPV